MGHDAEGGKPQQRPGPGRRPFRVPAAQDAIERQGLQEIMWATGTGGKWRFAEEFARQVMERY